MKYAIIFAAFAISWGLMASAHVSDGYHIMLVFTAGLASYAASTSK